MIETNTPSTDVVQSRIPNAEFHKNERAIYNKLAANIMRLPLTYSRWGTTKVRSGQTIDIGLSDGHVWPLNLATMLFCAPAQKHKIGNTITHLRFIRSNELMQKKKISTVMN